MYATYICFILILVIGLKKQQGGCMLVITRKQNQTILINGDTEIRISAINGNEVKIGISAPEDVDVVRGELLQENRNVLIK